MSARKHIALIGAGQIGGILALIIGDFNMSVSASVGFIALFGVASYGLLRALESRFLTFHPLSLETLP